MPSSVCIHESKAAKKAHCSLDKNWYTLCILSEQKIPLATQPVVLTLFRAHLPIRYIPVCQAPLKAIVYPATCAFHWLSCPHPFLWIQLGEGVGVHLTGQGPGLLISLVYLNKNSLQKQKSPPNMHRLYQGRPIYRCSLFFFFPNVRVRNYEAGNTTRGLIFNLTKCI